MSFEFQSISGQLGTRRALVAALLAALLVAATGCREDAEAPAPAATGEAVSSADGPSSSEGWKALRARQDETVWAEETLAREYEQSLFALWDALLGADPDDPATVHAVLAAIEFEELEVATPKLIEELEHGIRSFRFDAPRSTWTRGDWIAFLDELVGEGVSLVQTEWHHARFTPPTGGAAARSSVGFALHLLDRDADRRSIIEGELAVEWSAERDGRGNPIPARIDATDLLMLTRSGPAPFRRILGFGLRDQGSLSRLHPVLLHDLDRDGLTDIVLVGGNRVLWNRGAEGFRARPLQEHGDVLTETGVIADLNGDAHPDLLTTRARGDLVLYPGDATGRFSGEPQRTPEFESPLRAPSVLTVGDVDGDGDLDVWVGQYKRPYDGGQMPTPFYDANDGHPGYLLLNDGKGRFRDATEAAGLAAKRFRRTYAASFVDLDGDTDLDLLVVSDFAGVDLHHNDGRGNFVDATDSLRSDRHLFGMSAAFADFDLDGRLDFFVAGMASTTARRLEALGLERSDRPEMREMRMRMAFGNRMYLASDSGWREPDFRGAVARTGWTWGTTAFDFDNDADPDLFAANGHQSGESTQDYCSNFWTHDIFDADSQPDPALDGLFEEVTAGFRSGAESWDGYQKNHLLMNRGGRDFVDIAFLLGVADEFDSRSAVSADLDLDGRVDLLVIESDADEGEKLHVYRNELETPNHWIGVQLREEGGGLSPVGASVTVRSAGRTQVGRVMNGETVMGQHAPTLHFGLADADRVESIEVRWIGGAKRVLRNPEVDRYHLVSVREGEAVASVVAP